MAAILTLHSVCLYPLKFSLTRNSKMPRAVLSRGRANKMHVPYELKEGQSRLFHKLPSGLTMEVIVQKGVVDKGPDSGVRKETPLVFVHGSYHAAWCWAEHWLPFFSASGYDCFSISLLAQGESDEPSGAVAGTLQTHAGDVADFINEELTVPPVLLGHSFEMGNLFPKLTGAVLVCSVPPSGNSRLVWRYLLTKPIAAFKVTRSLATKAFQTSLPLCKETFFSSAMEDHDVQRYQALMKESSRMPLFDLRKLNASLPIPLVPKSGLELFVMGSNDDFIVDIEGLNETGAFYGVSPICVKGVAHDMMLDSSWEKGAQVILSWLNSFVR